MPSLSQTMKLCENLITPAHAKQVRNSSEALLVKKESWPTLYHSFTRPCDCTLPGRVLFFPYFPTAYCMPIQKMQEYLLRPRREARRRGRDAGVIVSAQGGGEPPEPNPARADKGEGGVCCTEHQMNTKNLLDFLDMAGIRCYSSDEFGAIWVRMVGEGVVEKKTVSDGQNGAA